MDITKFDPKAPKKSDVFDVLFLLWIVLALAIAVGPLLEPLVGKARAALTEAGILLLAIAYLKFRKLPVALSFRWTPVPWKALPFMIVIAISGAVLLDGIDRLTASIIPFPPEALEQLRNDLTAETVPGLIWILFGIAIVGPIVEESIFRGAIQSWLEAHGDATRAVLVTSLVFSLLHLQFAWLIQLLVMAVTMGWLALHWKSIIPAVLLHAANNIWSYLILIHFSEEQMNFYLWHGQVNPFIVLAGILLFGIGLRASEKIRLHN